MMSVRERKSEIEKQERKASNDNVQQHEWQPLEWHGIFFHTVECVVASRCHVYYRSFVALIHIICCCCVCRDSFNL